MEHRFRRAQECASLGERRDFEVDAKGAIVEVCRANTDDVVAEKDLVMEERGLVAVEADTSAQNFFVVRKGGALHECVTAIVWDEDSNIDPAKSGELQARHNRFIGHEVGSRYPEPPACVVYRLMEQEGACLEFIGWACWHKQHPFVSTLACFPGERRDLACSPVPILAECQLRRKRSGPLDLNMRITPLTEGGIVTEMFVADIRSSHERCMSIDDDDLPMIAKVEMERIQDAPRGKACALHTAALEGSDVRACQGERPHIVHKKQHLNASCRRLKHR